MFTIEPMICEGVADPFMWDDDWTATTRDGGRSAQFEHTLLVTEDGVEALTGKIEGSPVQFWEAEGMKRPLQSLSWRRDIYLRIYDVRHICILPLCKRSMVIWVWLRNMQCL